MVYLVMTKKEYGVLRDIVREYGSKEPSVPPTEVKNIRDVLDAFRGEE